MRLNKEERRVEAELSKLAGRETSSLEHVRWRFSHNDRNLTFEYRCTVFSTDTKCKVGYGQTPAAALRALKSNMRARGSSNGRDD